MQQLSYTNKKIMHQLFSRYGGHMHIIARGKASAQDLPEDQSLENMLSEHAFRMSWWNFWESEINNKYTGNGPFVEGFKKQEKNNNTSIILKSSFKID